MHSQEKYYKLRFKITASTFIYVNINALHTFKVDFCNTIFLEK